MAMEGVKHIRGAVRATASTNIAANLLSCVGVTAGTMGLAGVSASAPVATHITYDAVASGAVGDFYPLSSGDEILVKTSTAFTCGDLVKGGASGEVAVEADIDTLTAATIGTALSDGAGSSGLAWVLVR